MTFRTLLICIVGPLLLMNLGCQSGNDQQNQPSEEQLAGSEASPSASEGSNMRTRGLDAASQPGFSFPDSFPALTSALAQDQAFLSTLTSYALKVMNPSGIQSEEDLLVVLEQRDSTMIPRMETALMNADENQQLYESYDALQDELLRLGMQMTFAEGTFTSVGPSLFLQDEIERYASEAFQLYLQFKEAHTASFNGEYPFLNMQPYLEMIQAGGELAALEETNYFPRIKQEYEQALIYFSDIHQVQDPTARNEASLFVQGIETDMYPFMTEADTRQAYVDGSDGSAFQKAMARIMANPSAMSSKPGHLYLVVVEWADNEELARSRVASHLVSGEDVPHHLRINLADGSARFAIVYRFFEEESAAEAALATASESFADAELMMVSVNGGELYQIGG